MQETASRFFVFETWLEKSGAGAAAGPPENGGLCPFTIVKGLALAVTAVRSLKGAAAPAPRGFYVSVLRIRAELPVMMVL